jgi:ribose 5-phosphate isomerase B
MGSSERILIASDHAGVLFKAQIIQQLPEWLWEDLGPSDTKSVDYPDYAHQVALKIASGLGHRGVLICGSGIGMSIAANKTPGVRAALAENPVSARLAREHNDANILCLGARLIAPEYGIEIARVWLTTPFNQSPKHIQRIKKITALEKK